MRSIECIHRLFVVWEGIKMKPGDKFKGMINNEIFEVINIDYIHNVIHYSCKGKIFQVGLEMFNRCLLEKIND